jgi:hypothetical protein
MPSANRRPPPEIPDISASNWNNARGAVHRFMTWSRQSYSGLPPQHAATHLVNAIDELQDAGPPAETDPNLGADVGEGPSYAREDHRHGIDLKGTTKGDLIVYNGSEYVRLPVGADGTVLTADSTQAAGLAWTTIAEDAEFLAFIGL